MTGIDPDEVIDSDQWLQHQGGHPTVGRSILNTFGILGGLAYGLSEKDGLIPSQPGQFKRIFNRLCTIYAVLTLGPFVLALLVALVFVLLGAVGIDHNHLWHSICTVLPSNGVCD